MKVISNITITAVLLASLQAFAGNAPAPKEASNCMVCHDVEANKTGPTFKDIAKKYTGQKNIQNQLAERIMKGTTSNSMGWMKAGKATMPVMFPNPSLKPEEAEKLAKWVLSIK